MSIGRLGVPVRNLPGSTTLLPDLHEASIAHRGKGAAGQPPGARRALPSLNRPGLATQAWRRAPEACALRVPWLECHRKQATAELSRGNTPARPAVSRASNSKLPRFVYWPAGACSLQANAIAGREMPDTLGRSRLRPHGFPLPRPLNSTGGRPQMPFVIGRVHAPVVISQSAKTIDAR